jgi:4-hydroxy-3-methylbut-2-en-1-yl diphosphate reductase
MNVTIDKNSGFCFGVVRAINTAESELDKSEKLFCLGDIVHNGVEVSRLEGRGLKIITHNEFRKMHDCKVMIRAHGEHPNTYSIAKKNNIELIDASCPVVLKLQQRIKRGYDEDRKTKGQIVIFGKLGHAEVIGLAGQTNEEAIIITKESDLDKIDYSRPIRLYSQTTMGTEYYNNIISIIKERAVVLNPDNKVDIIIHNTICRRVANRVQQIEEFAFMFEVIIFVSGKKSSNGMFLYGVSKSVNKNTYLVSDFTDLQKSWFDGFNTVGVCGATSTPMWLMKKVAKEIEKI